MERKIELGDEVQCTLTGFKGIVVSLHNYLHGCTRVGVQPKCNKEKNNLPEAKHFDEPQLKVIKRKRIPRGNTKIGGPDKYMDKGRH